jgi:hypothetical protein
VNCRKLSEIFEENTGQLTNSWTRMLRADRTAVSGGFYFHDDGDYFCNVFRIGGVERRVRSDGQV